MAEKSIHFELFTASEAKQEVATEGEVEIRVILDDKTFNVRGNADEFVLDLLLEEGIDAPYSCQGGSCSSCICKITEGSADMARNQVLTDNEITNGFILSCQAKITSTTIAVDFDNV
jgi:ring-1,2-phenylacetyl-CoA epoxidase subunit PaaE